MSDLNTLITEHWNAKAALDVAKEREKLARQALADFLCKDEESLKNKTMALSGGWKLKQEILRTVRIDKSHEDYKKMPTIMSPDLFNKLVKTKQSIEISYAVFKTLPDEIKAEVSKYLSVNEAISIKYEQPTDNR